MDTQVNVTAEGSSCVAGKLKLLSIVLAGGEYAFPLQEIRRIIPAEGIEADSIAPDFVYGAMTIGDDRLAVIDLRERLGLGGTGGEETAGRSVVVVEIDGVRVGFLIDAVGSLYDVGGETLQASEWMNDLSGAHKRGLGFLEIGDNAMEAISFSGVLSSDELASIDSWRVSEGAVLHIAARDERIKRKAEEEALAQHPMRDSAGRYLIVRVGAHYLGIRTVQIAEVLPCDSLVDIPLTKDEFSGMLLLRGVTHPVIDLRLRLGLPESEDGVSRPGIVLVRDGEGLTGLFVQQIVQLSDIEVGQIHTAEDASVDIYRYLITACARLPIGDVILVDVVKTLQENKPSLLEGSRAFMERGCAAMV